MATSCWEVGEQEEKGSTSLALIISCHSDGKLWHGLVEHHKLERRRFCSPPKLLVHSLNCGAGFYSSSAVVIVEKVRRSYLAVSVSAEAAGR